MPNSHPSFTFRPPLDLLQALEDTAKATGKGRSALVIEALRLYLGQPKPDDTITATDLKRLNDRLGAIELEVRAQAARLSKVETEPEGDRNVPFEQRHQETTAAGAGPRGRKRHAEKGGAHPAEWQVTSVAEAILVLRHALDTMKPNNAGPGLRGIQQVLPSIETSERLPQATKDQLLRHLKPEEAFDRTKGGRVKAAINGALAVLEGPGQESV